METVFTISEVCCIVSLFLGERSVSENNYFQVVLFLVKEWCLSRIVFRTDLLRSFIHSLLHIIVILNLQFLVAYGCQWFEVTLSVRASLILSKMT